MASRRPFWLFVMAVAVALAVLTPGCGSSGVGHMPSSKEEGEDFKEFKVKTEQAGEKAADAGKEAKEASESWAEWAKEKLSEGLGFKQDETKESATKRASDKAADTAKTAKDKVQDMASG